MVKYLQPRNMQELLAAQKELVHASYEIVAGGTDTMVKRHDGRDVPDTILSLSHMAELRGISESGDAILIGAMTTHREIAESKCIRKHFGALSEACAGIGSAQIRNLGTIGGNIVTASPAGDTIPCLYLFDARLTVLRADGTLDELPIKAFMEGTRLNHGDILLGVILIPEPDVESHYLKLARREAVSIAEISVAARWKKEAGKITNSKAYLGAIARQPIELEEFAHINQPKINISPAESLTSAAESLVSVTESLASAAESLASAAEPLVSVTESLASAAEPLASAAESLIRRARENRSKPSRLRITEAEQLYKERAVRGLIYDLIDLLEIE